MLFRYLSLSISLAITSASASTLPGSADLTNPDYNSYRLIQRPDGSIQREFVQEPADGTQKYMIELRGKAVLPRLQQHNKTTKLQQIAAPLLLQAENQLKAEQQQLTQELLQQQLINDVHASTSLLFNSLIVSANPADIAKIAALPNVKKVHADHELQLYRDKSIPLILADKAWALEDNNGTVLSGKGIRVGVLDSGIDYTHPDLGGCFGDSCKVAGGYDFYNNDADPIDTEGHGTHVAGIIAGNGTVKGVAPEATLYAYRVCHYYCPTSAVIQALEHAADPDQNSLSKDALDIVNLSLGGPGSLDDPLTIAANNASKAGMVVVVAAGNDAEAYDALGTPGNAELAITVAASYLNDKITDFSSRGPSASDLILKPDLAAPGNNINSTMPNGQFQGKSGTSMAAPHVAGAAALLKQQNNNRTPDEIKSLLVNSSKKLDEPVSATGSGRLDVLAAAQNKLIFSPSSLSFGKFDAEQPLWTSARQLKLHNKSQSNEVLQLSVPDLPSGVTVQILANNQPQTQVTIAPGDSVELSLQLSVDSSVYQIPNNVLLEDFALVVQNQQQQQQRVALAFLVYNQLQVDSPQFINRLQIYNHKGERKFNGILAAQSKLRLAKAESYDFIAEFYSVDQMQLVVLENQQLADSGSIRITPEQAVHKLEVTAVTDPNGVTIPTENLVGGLNSVEIRHPTKPVFYKKLFRPVSPIGSGGGPIMFKGKTLWVSPFSSQYQLAAFASWKRTNTTANETEIYTWNSRFQGISAQQQVALNAAKMHRFQSVITPDNSQRSLTFGYKNELALGKAAFALSDLSGIIGFGVNISTLDARQAHTVRIYGQSLTFEPVFGTGIFNLNVTEKAPTAGHGYVSSDYRRFWGEKGTAIIMRDYDTASFSPVLKFAVVDKTGEHRLSFHHHWISMSAYAYPNHFMLSMQRRDIYNNQFNNYPLAQPELASSVTLRCDIQPAEPVRSDNFSFNLYGDCKTADIEVKYPTALAEIAQDSYGKITLIKQSAKSSPLISGLKFGDDRSVSQQLSQGRGFIEFQLEKSVTGSAEVHYQGKWHPLNLQATTATTELQLDYRAEFSLPATSALASFRIRAEHSSGNKTEYLLQNAAIVGSKPEDALLADNDKDGQPNATDKDDDNDNISDIDELRYNLDIYQNDNNADYDSDGLTNQQELTMGTFPDLADSDQDKLPDGYEHQAGFNPLNATDGNADPDRDLLTNGEEYVHKTDPYKEDTDDDLMPDGFEVLFGLKPLDATDAGGDLDNDALTNLYEFKYRTNPTSADTDKDGMSDGFETQFGLKPLDYEDAEKDLDRDNLKNLDEFKLNTNPTNVDTDGDTMRDGYEVRYNLNPLDKADANTDLDQDTLTNLQEFKQQTNPRSADTDSDSMPDGFEVQYGLSPLSATDANADLDNDKLSNLEEFKHKTNPTLADTDGDLLPDGYEVLYSLNPLDAADATSDKDQDGFTALQELQTGTNPTVSDKKSGGGSSAGGASTNDGGGGGGSMGFSVLSLAAIWCYRRQYRQQHKTQQANTLF